MYVLVHVCAFNKDIFFGFIKCKHFIFPFVYFQYYQTVETEWTLWAVSGYIYTGQASMDMYMDGKFHIHGNPGYGVLFQRNSGVSTTSRKRSSARYQHGDGKHMDA